MPSYGMDRSHLLQRISHILGEFMHAPNGPIGRERGITTSL